MATKTKVHKVQLVDLDGVSNGKLMTAYATSRTCAINLLRKHRAATAARHSGAITIWQTDDGRFRCEFHRLMRRINSSTFLHLASVNEWLKEWWPQMRRQ